MEERRQEEPSDGIEAKVKARHVVERVYERLLREISRSTPEFASGEKNIDKITPFGNYSVTRPPETPDERACNDEFVAFAIRKFDEVFKTGGYYEREFLSRGTSGLRDLVQDDYIEEPYGADVIHALTHEATLPGAFERFKYQGRDIDRPELTDNLYEILVFWVQHDPSQAKRISSPDALIVRSITNRLDKTPRPVEEVVRDFFGRYGDQIDSDLVARWFPDMVDDIGGGETPLEKVRLPRSVQEEFVSAVKNALGQWKRSSSDKDTTPQEFFNRVMGRFLKTMVGDPSLGKPARKDFAPEDVANRLMSWHNALRLKSKALMRKYGMDIEDIHRKFDKKAG